MELKQILLAREILGNIVPQSRVVRARSLSEPSGANVFLFLENEGPIGTFKLRGAYYTLHQRMQKSKIHGVVTASSGNHGLAIAYAAKLLGMPARVYLPVGVNPAKRARIVQQCAEVVEAGAFVEESRDQAANFARESGWLNIFDGQDDGLTIGAATIGIEIIEQVPTADVIWVPIGDSTLIRGVAFAAKYLRRDVRVIGVQAERAPAYYLSFHAGRALSTDFSDTVADGLAVRETHEDNVRELVKLVDDIQLVSDDEMLRALRHLLLEEHVLAEPAAAASTAAFVKTDGSFSGKNVVLVVSGANISEEHLRRALPG
jgi:threonine dehydratase